MNHRTDAATVEQNSLIRVTIIFCWVWGGHRRCIIYGAEHITVEADVRVVSCELLEWSHKGLLHLLTWPPPFFPPLVSTGHRSALLKSVQLGTVMFGRHYLQWTCLKRLAAQPCLGTHVLIWVSMTPRDTTLPPYPTTSHISYISRSPYPPSPNQYGSSGNWGQRAFIKVRQPRSGMAMNTAKASWPPVHTQSREPGRLIESFHTFYS